MMNCTGFHLLGLQASWNQPRNGRIWRGKETRTKEGRDRDRKRERFVRKWRGFPGFGISIRNIGRRWLQGAAARNLEFPLVIKSYPLQEEHELAVGWEWRRIQMELDGRRQTNDRGFGKTKEKGLRNEDGRNGSVKFTGPLLRPADGT